MERSVSDILGELDLFKQYMMLKITCDFAVETGSYDSFYYPGTRLTTTLFKEQIPTFDEYKRRVKECGWGDPQYHPYNRGTRNWKIGDYNSYTHGLLPF